MNAIKRRRPAWAIVLSLLVLVVATGVVGAGSSAAVPTAVPNDNFTLHLDVPHGARIEYLRLFYYDTSPANSQAWITTYNAQGSLTDLTTITSTGATGYGTTLSPQITHVVDTANNAYVLNWRANQLGKSMRLCGLRVAYRLPVGAGWSNYYYFFAAGSSMQPRDSGSPWTYDGAGCVSIPYQTFLPLIMRK